jgi:hypothetical protein
VGGGGGGGIATHTHARTHRYGRICTSYAALLAEECSENRANGGPWEEQWRESQEIISTCCDELAKLCDGGEVLGGSVDEANIRPPQLLVDLLEFRSKWVLKMLGTDELDECINLMSQANRCEASENASLGAARAKRAPPKPVCRVQAG